ncbi:mitochondrial ribosomal protein subunit L20-domain-containing protein [Chaetomidium leptoderma]|uniref:Mitochondrial ribosomal protein subunit L20-domain-containing protein n=1 Tax=Chaetomidium leptoderma TaxID=669021 RepID=A0AAN6VMF4_9PEZI|nr:mitochondrial ribosomal protein subunit L20-domain-containing protein [Chaetomidium leptoderma]
MEAIVVRPAVSCCRSAVSAGPTSSRLLLNTLPTGIRQKSTSARTRRALNIPPHPSFLNANNSTGNSGPDGLRGTRRDTDQIIFNPPSSAPSVFHTPFKFLPKNDPRRRANLTSSLFASSTTIHYNATQQQSSSTSPTSMPAEQTFSPEDFPMAEGPVVLKPRHHLAKADIEEMRRLRETDPVTNSVQSLARQYQCSKLFVLMCCQAPREHQDKIKAGLEKTKERWGPRRRAAREERARREGMLRTGEL